MLHPKELLGKLGSLFLNMLLSLKVILDHIAEYLLLLSDAPMFWFTPNTSYDHFFHLSSSCPAAAVVVVILHFCTWAALVAA